MLLKHLALNYHLEAKRISLIKGTIKMNVSKDQAFAIQRRSAKIAFELSQEGLDGYMTAVAILGWMISTMPKALADQLSETLTEDIRNFPGYPK